MVLQPDSPHVGLERRDLPLAAPRQADLRHFADRAPAPERINHAASALVASIDENHRPGCPAPGDRQQRWAQLNAARPDEAWIRRTARWAASAPPHITTAEVALPGPEVVNGLAVEDLLAFRQEAWTKITAHVDTPKRS
jgi:hypothetical protein